MPVRCLDVDTGKVIAEAASVKRAWSITTASESSRVVIAQYRWELENRPTTSVLDRRIIWDFRTGRQIATWRPEFQKWRFPIGEIKQGRSNPFVFAISPTGRCIAEGGNGILRLYEMKYSRNVGYVLFGCYWVARPCRRRARPAAPRYAAPICETTSVARS